MEDYLDEDVDLKKFFSRYSVDVIASTCFASQIDCYNRDKSNAFIDNVGLVFKPNIFNFALFVTLPTWLYRVLKLEVFPHSPMKYFQHIVRKEMRERKAKQIRAHDFMQLLIDIWDETEGLDSKSKMITETELIPQAITFISGGHETTSAWLSSTFYLLALNPDFKNGCTESSKISKTWSTTR
ncbi:Cytochrome P450 3A41 [Halotydeus destructor]|nr:Cytochrome P450 3A41 [Halotydeus destructor]